MVSTLPEKNANYRHEADTIRAKVHETRDADVRVQLLLIASLYDKLADHLALAPQPKPSDKASQKDATE
jgi:hypothetical protein